MTDYAFGVDISKYQFSEDGSKKPDFEKVKATCNFIAIRAGISWGYTDPWFRYSWDAVRGMPRMAYHVPYFGESAQRQMDNFFNIVEPVADWRYDRLVLDCEVQGSNSPAVITATTNKMLAICKARTGRYPIVYSRALWVNEHMRVKDMPKVDWWLAQYRFALPSPLYTPEYPSPPNLPNGVSDWLIHQTAERYNGSAVGVVSRYVDSNRWNGSVLDVLRYFGMDNVEPEPEVPPELSDKEKLDKLWEAHPELHGLGD